MLKSNKLISFLVIGGGLYLLWLIIYYLIIKEYTLWDYYLNYNLADWTIQFFDWFGVNSYMDIESDHVRVFFVNSDHSGVWVGDNCNGFKLFSIFSIFIIAFPSKNWKSKIWYVPLGVLVVHFANILRIMALMLINDKNPSYLDFNHDYTFTIFVYGIIFILWWWWLNKFSTKNEGK